MSAAAQGQVQVKNDEVKQEIDNNTNYVITLNSSQLNDISGDIRELVAHIQKFMFRNPSEHVPIKIEPARKLTRDNDKGTQTIIYDSKGTQTMESIIVESIKKQRVPRKNQPVQEQISKTTKITTKTQSKLKEIAYIQPSNSQQPEKFELVNLQQQLSEYMFNRVPQYQDTLYQIDQIQNIESQIPQPHSDAPVLVPRQITKLKIVTRDQNCQNLRQGQSQTQQVQRKKVIQVEKSPPQNPLNYEIEYKPKPDGRKRKRSKIATDTTEAVSVQNSENPLDNLEDLQDEIAYAKKRKQLWRICLICGERYLRLNTFNKHLFEVHGIEQRKYWKPLKDKAKE